MSKLIKRVFFAIVILLLLVSGIGYLLPYYWGNHIFKTKVTYLNKASIEPNTLFFGSSRIYRQLDPSVFDKTTGTTRSFNLGTPGTYFFETLFLVEEFIKERDHKIENIFIELQPVVPVSASNTSSAKGTYYLNQKWYNSVISFFDNNTNLTEEEKTTISKNYRNCYINHLLKVNWINQLASDFIKTKILKYDYLGKVKNGYYSLDAHMKNAIYEKGYKRRNAMFLRDTTILTKQKKKILTAYQDNKSLPNMEYLQALQAFATAAKANGVDVFYIIAPRLRYDFEELLATSSKLEPSHLIDLAHPDLYPEFYTAKYSFDRDHLNKEGAKLFSKEIATQFITKNHSN